MATFLIRGKTAPDVNTPVRPPLVVHDVNEQSLWQHSHGDRNVLLRLLTSVKFYGAGGQAPTKRWQPYYNYDVGCSNWQWEPPPSSLIVPLLTNVKFFGVGGQAPTKRWQAHYNQYEPPVWWRQFPPYNLALVQRQCPDDQSWFYNQPNDQANWQWRPPLRNAALTSLQTRAATWRYNYDDAANWTWRPPLKNTALTSLQVRAGTWRHGYNDAANWQWQAPTNAPLLTGGQAQAKPGPWRYDYDHASGWQPFSVRNRNLLDAHGPFSQGGWRFDFAGEQLWQFTALLNLPLLSPAPTPTPTPTGGVGWPQGPGRRRHDPEETARRIERQRPFNRKVWEELKAAHAAALAAEQTALAQQIQARLDAELLAQAQRAAALEQARGQEDDDSRQRRERQAALDAFAASAGWQRIQGTFAGHPTLDLAALKARLQQQQDEDDEDEAIAMLLLS